MIELITKTGERVELLTSIKELTDVKLKDMTENIAVAPNYVLVGIIYREKINYILNAVKSRNSFKSTTNVVPVFVKANADNGFVEGITTGSKLIVSATDLSRGFHAAPIYNPYDIGTVCGTILEDVSLTNDCMMGKIYKDKDENNIKVTPYHYFVEFKIIPACDIHGFYKINNLRTYCELEDATDSSKQID